MATQTYVNSVTLTDAAEFNKFDTAAYAALSGVAGTNTITATGPANLTLVATNPPLWFIPAATNTGATTLNITPSGGAALGAKNVFWNGAACIGGEIRSGVPVSVVYDGTQYNIVGNGSAVPVGFVNAKGDLLAGTAADAVARLAVGTNGDLVMADSSQTTGLNYGGRGGVLSFVANAAVADGSTNYMNSAITSTTEVEVSTPVPFACVAKNLRAARSAGGAGTAAFTFRVNGADTTLTCSITGAATTNSDTSNTVNVAAGDTLSMKVILSGGATTAFHKAMIELVKTGA